MEKDVFDVIFEEGWFEHMNISDTKDKWEIVKYSKSQIIKAGKVISSISTNVSLEEFSKAIDVLNNWRASHTKSALKASMGDDNVLRFFQLTSSYFALIEHTEAVPGAPENLAEIINELQKIENEHKIISRLSAIRVAKNIVERKKGEYYILLLNYETMMLRVKASNNIEEATAMYNNIESEDKDNIDAVLVSASSFGALKAAYPNYFADIGKFVRRMKKIIIIK